MTPALAAPVSAAVFVEIKNVKQERGAGRRRWFEADGMELVLWLDGADHVTGFQLCYEVGGGECALTWREALGFEHSEIDSGEESPLKNQTPILRPHGTVPWTAVARRFQQNSGSLDAALRELIQAQLALGAAQAETSRPPS